MASPSNRRATKRRRSSITELAFHGIHTSRPQKAKSVTHVSGTECHLCLGPLTLVALNFHKYLQPCSSGAFQPRKDAYRRELRMLKLRQEGNENLSWPPKRLPDDVREE